MTVGAPGGRREEYEAPEAAQSPRSPIRVDSGLAGATAASSTVHTMRHSRRVELTGRRGFRSVRQDLLRWACQLNTACSAPGSVHGYGAPAGEAGTAETPGPAAEDYTAGEARTWLQDRAAGRRVRSSHYRFTIGTFTSTAHTVCKRQTCASLIRWHVLGFRLTASRQSSLCDWPECHLTRC